MGLGVSILLVAVGAILVWGVTSDAEGIDVDAIGVILMVVGLLGFVLSMLFWSSWGGVGGYRRRRTYAEPDPYARPVATSRRVDVVEDDVDVRGPGGPPPPP